MLLFLPLSLSSSEKNTKISSKEISPIDSELQILGNPLWLPSKNTSHRHTQVLSVPIGKKIEVAKLEGPAIINHIWITSKCIIPQIQGLMILRVWWDDEKEPSIEALLGDFFGVGFGQERNFKSLMLEMIPAGGEQHSALNCYWKMPFKKSARFEIENRSNRTVSMFFIQIDYEKYPELPPETLYFHSQYRRENPVALHIPYTILTTTGRGNYVGTIMNYHLLGPGAWVEGGQDFYIDDEKNPSLPGTGAEDYFGHAWGFRIENSALFHGTSFGPENNKMTAYRFHIPDLVHFKNSIKVTMKCHGWDVQDRQDDYSSVALWYQTEPHSPFPKLPPPDFDYLELSKEFRKNPLEIVMEKMKNLPFKGENLSLKVKDYKESGHFDIDGLGKMAMDGDIGTKWCEIEHPNAHWLSIDLGKDCSIEGFVIKNPSATGDTPGFDVKALTIEKASSLDGPYEKIIEKNYSAEISKVAEPDTAVMIIPLEKPITARFIRLFISKSCDLDTICRIQEFEVWGKQSP